MLMPCPPCRRTPPSDSPRFCTVDRLCCQDTMANFLYVDNSNVWIEGLHVAAVENGHAPSIWDAIENKICDYSWKLDFGKLYEFAGGERGQVGRAVLYGSRPPQNDSLWKIAAKKGF